VGRRIGARLGGALLTLFVASVAVFLILRLIPADPARLIVGPLASTSFTLEDSSGASGASITALAVR